MEQLQRPFSRLNVYAKEERVETHAGCHIRRALLQHKYVLETFLEVDIGTRPALLNVVPVL